MADVVGMAEERAALEALIAEVDQQFPARRVTGFIDTGGAAPVVRVFFDVAAPGRKSYEVPAAVLVRALRRHLGVERLT